MSNGRRCRRAHVRRDRPVADSASWVDCCDVCGHVLGDDVAVFVMWVDGPKGPEPDEAIVCHRVCAGLIQAEVESELGGPVTMDTDGSWLRKAAS